MLQIDSMEDVGLAYASRKVLDAAAERAGWGAKLSQGIGRGIAIHESFGTIVAQVADVTVGAKGEVRVDRVVVAVDCGHVINPRLVEMQIESGVIYGLTAALGDAITIKDGAVEQTNFDSYPMLRMADAPRIETHLVLSGGKRWGGIGEPGTPLQHLQSATQSMQRPASASALYRFPIPT